MADLAAVAGGADQLPAVHDKATTDTDRAPDQDHVVDVAGRTTTMLGKDREVGLVGEGDRDIHPQGIGEDIAEWLIAPAEVRGHRDHAVAASDDTDDGDPYSDDALLGRDPTAKVGCESRECGGDVRDARAPARQVDPHMIEDLPAKPDGRRSERIDGDLQREHDGPVGIGTDER